MNSQNTIQLLILKTNYYHSIPKTNNIDRKVNLDITIRYLSKLEFLIS